MKKSEIKMEKSAISGKFPRLVPVPNMGGTDTTYAKPKWYQYQDKVVPVPLMQRQNGTGTIQSGTGTTHQNMIGTGTNHSGTGTDAVPLLLATLIFYILTLLSSN